MGNIFTLDSVSQIHEVIGCAKPTHPLITLIQSSEIDTKRLAPFIDQQVVSNLYSISLKNGTECEMIYGRKPYDFKEGTMIFLAPNQAIIPTGASKNMETDEHSWNLIFHPDLIRKSLLGKKMHEYSFFSYESHEALHVSEKERQTVTNIALTIKHEYSQNLDDYSQDLIISNLELLLNYSKRFYGRQFLTRTTVNKDIVVRFENFLAEYFESDKPESQGVPSVKECAKELGYSANYLSDLLKKETGRNTQEHIHFHVIEKAKTLLLGSEEPVYRIAYALGFEYPQHFSKLFKRKTGVSPAEYRN